MQTQKIRFVSAIYSIYRNAYAGEVWDRLKLLASVVPLHLFCCAEDAPRAAALPGVRVHIKEFKDLETYHTLCDSTELPEIRKPTKDTKDFMVLMNAKSEFIHDVKIAFPAEHYVWIDAGISKIFRNPIESFREMYNKVQKQLKTQNILIPGCNGWGPTTDTSILTNRVSWRFCGGFFIVPYGLVNRFHRVVLQGCQELIDKTRKATWEVNVWVYKENSIPIQWSYGDHNEAIFACIDHYIQP